MLPFFRFSISGSTALVKATPPKKLTFIMVLITSMLRSLIFDQWLSPALFIRISTWPKRAITFCAAASIKSCCETSSGSTNTSASGKLHATFTRSNSSSRRADKTSFAFCLAKVYANASPIPDDAPVIQTTLFSKYDIDVNYERESNYWKDIMQSSS